MEIKLFLKTIGIDRILGQFSNLFPSLSIRLRYLISHGHLPDLKHPETLDEKIQWLKLNVIRKDPLYTLCADKLTVRKFVEDCGCGDLLNDLIAVYNNAESVEWDRLPNKFAIKWNFGSGYNIICPDKSGLDVVTAERLLHYWGNAKKYTPGYEPQYDNIKRKIIVEKYLEGPDQQLPVDYKIYASYGKASVIMVCLDRVIGKEASYYYLTRDWKLLPWSREAIESPDHLEKLIRKPSQLEDLFHYAEILSVPFPFVRVDFYIVDNKVYFGELTFTPSGGFDPGCLPEGQMALGNMISLPDDK